MSPNRRGQFFLWVPAAFCGFLSLTRLFLHEAADPAFYAFLPMCFVYLAMVQLSLVRRIEALEGRAAAPPDRTA